MNIVFWNLRKKDLSDLLASLVLSKNLDIVLLAEADPRTVSSLLAKLNGLTKPNNYNQIACTKDRVVVISRYSATVFTDKSDLYKSTRYVSFKIKIPTLIELNLIGIHFHSKDYWSDISLAMECATVANSISLVENDSKTTDTIVIGDFNMSPYESGMVAANGFHALTDLEYLEARPKGREIDEMHYPFFYNPMWNFFGDHSQPLGTLYYRTPGNVNYEWHIFDQILIRPSLKKYLVGNYIQIITKIGNDSLIDGLKRPDGAKYSDHLPIIIKFKL